MIERAEKSRIQRLRIIFMAITAGLIGGAWMPLYAAGEPLVVAITGTAIPFSHRNKHGELIGFNVDIVRTLCQRLKRECQFEVRKFPEILPLVAAGKADIGVGNYLKTPEREQQVRFSLPYWRSTSSFIGAQTIKLPPLEQIPLHHRLCITQDSKQSAFMHTISKGKTEAIVPSASNQQALDHLKAQHCTLALMPTMQGLNFLQSPAGKGYAFLGTPLTQEGLSGDVHIVIKPASGNLQQQIDIILRELIADGTHERLSRKYFPFSIL